MKQKIFSKCLCNLVVIITFLCTGLLSAINLIPLVCTVNKKQIQINISTYEIETLFSDQSDYVYIGKETSNITNVINKISQLDDNEQSLIHSFKNHIEEGNAIVRHDSIALILEQANKTLYQNRNKLDADVASDLTKSLKIINNQLMNKSLSLEAECSGRMLFAGEYLTRL